MFVVVDVVVVDKMETLSRLECYINSVTPLTQDVFWTSIPRFMNVMDARWTSKQRCVLTDILVFYISLRNKLMLTHDVIKTLFF